MNNYLKEYKKRVCIVGNGDSLLDKGMGDEIDSHDIVVRINHCFTIGLEKDAGSKCTHWCINQVYASSPSFISCFFIPRVDELKPYGLHTIIRRTDPISSLKDEHSALDSIFANATFNQIVGEELNVISLNFRKETRANKFPLRFSNIIETTGLGLIYYFIKRYREVNIIGFGSPDQTNEIRHYWPPDGPEMSQGFSDRKHFMNQERQLINTLPVKRLDA